MPKQNAILSVEEVSKTYKGSCVLNSVSFSTVMGETLGILGPSGAGKSTLMRMLGGQVMPDTGDIFVAGTSMYRDYEKCMSLVGYVPEQPRFYNYMTCIDNLRTFADFYGGVSRSQVNDALIMMELGDYAYQKVEVCSYSTRYRLAMACALVNKPRVLLLSNLLDGLDPVSTVDIRRVLRRLSLENGVTTVITSRLIGELERMCDRVMVLKDGAVVGIGTVDGLKQASTGKLRHKLLLDQPEAAARYLKEAEGLRCELKGDMLIVDCEQAGVPRIINMLMARGNYVYEVTPIELSLEEAYYHLLREWSKNR